MISKDKSLLRVFGSLYAQNNVLLAALHYCSLGKQQSSLLYDSAFFFYHTEAFWCENFKIKSPYCAGRMSRFILSNATETKGTIHFS